MILQWSCRFTAPLSKHMSRFLCHLGRVPAEEEGLIHVTSLTANCLFQIFYQTGLIPVIENCTLLPFCSPTISAVLRLACCLVLEKNGRPRCRLSRANNHEFYVNGSSRRRFENHTTQVRVSFVNFVSDL